MARFTDKKGREWTLDLDVGLAEHVSKEAEVNLALSSGDWIRVVVEPTGRKLVEVLWLLVEEQAKATSITPEDFARGFGGDQLEKAGAALREAVVDFFPLRAVREAAREEMEKALRATEEEMRSRLLGTAAQ